MWVFQDESNPTKVQKHFEENSCLFFFGFIGHVVTLLLENRKTVNSECSAHVTDSAVKLCCGQVSNPVRFDQRDTPLTDEPPSPLKRNDLITTYRPPPQTLAGLSDAYRNMLRQFLRFARPFRISMFSPMVMYRDNDKIDVTMVSVIHTVFDHNQATKRPRQAVSILSAKTTSENAPGVAVKKIAGRTVGHVYERMSAACLKRPTAEAKHIDLRIMAYKLPTCQHRLTNRQIQLICLLLYSARTVAPLILASPVYAVSSDYSLKAYGSLRSRQETTTHKQRFVCIAYRCQNRATDAFDDRNKPSRNVAVLWSPGQLDCTIDDKLI
ncbi:hypothetical protein EVAR_50887_1 [Eumeta japonica]|uniref:Uncharacterized protein n=1 Tax=Eumeta variegata TaxID=151549 RepID=A0A4C1YE21_EUMVA|nr:hypothetical protein EVAR_50887_1 [Eumeta japonica]